MTNNNNSFLDFLSPQEQVVESSVDATDQVHNQGGFKAQTWDGKSFRNLHKVIKQMKDGKATEDDNHFRAKNIAAPATAVSNKANKQADYGEQDDWDDIEDDIDEQIEDGQYDVLVEAEYKGKKYSSLALTHINIKGGKPADTEDEVKLALAKVKGPVRLRYRGPHASRRLTPNEFGSFRGSGGHTRRGDAHGAAIYRDYDRMKKEEQEINELSKKTLGRYIGNAASDLQGVAYDSGVARTAGYSKGAKRYDAVANRRRRGIDLAARKLTKEQIEDLKYCILNEVTPPGMEDDAKKMKKSFKEQYGKDWKAPLYATLWKRYNKEELELNEVSKQLLARYSQKAGRSVLADRSKKNLVKRFKGIKQAAKRFQEDNLDELSQKTLGRYIGNAASDLAGASHDYAASRGTYPKSAEQARVRSNKRLAGINKATSKLKDHDVGTHLGNLASSLAGHAHDQAADIKAGYPKHAAREGERVKKHLKAINAISSRLGEDLNESSWPKSYKTKHRLATGLGQDAYVHFSVHKPSEGGADKAFYSVNLDDKKIPHRFSHSPYMGHYGITVHKKHEKRAGKIIFGEQLTEMVGKGQLEKLAAHHEKHERIANLKMKAAEIEHGEGSNEAEEHWHDAVTHDAAHSHAKALIKLRAAAKAHKEAKLGVQIARADHPWKG